MWIIQMFSILILVLNVLVGAMAVAHNPKNKLNISFATISAAFVFWVFSNLMVDLSQDAQDLLFWGRLTIVGPMFLPALFFWFFSMFPEQNPSTIKVEKRVFWVFLLLCLTQVFFAFTKYNLESVDASKIPPEYVVGPLYLFLSLNFLASTACIVLFLKKKYGILKTNDRKSVIFIIIGIIAAIIIGIITEVALVFFKIHAFTAVGSIISATVMLPTAYLIIRNKALNIRVVITETIMLIVLFFLSLEMIVSRSRSETMIRMALFLFLLLINFFLTRIIILENARREQVVALVKELEEKNTELHNLSQLKDDFLHLAVHEINNPMASILGYLSMILDEKIGKVDDVAEGYLIKVYNSSKRLSNVVGSFLDLAKLEGGKIKLNISTADLEELIQEVFSEYEESAKKGGNTLALDNLHLEKIMVDIDRDKIREALINFLDNSIRFTKNGTIRFVINKNDNHKHAVIYILDTGEGIPPDKIYFIFNKLYQANGEDIKNGIGSGLGLYIARSIIEMHGGSIIAESILGKGTKIIISLPIEN